MQYYPAPVSDPQSASIPTNGHRLRLLSYNIQVAIASTSFKHYLTHFWKHLLPHSETYRNLTNISKIINNFDIVALQEADAGSLRSSFINQIEFLARMGGFPYWSFQTNREIGILTKHSNGLLGRYEPYEISDYKLPGKIPGRGAMVVRYGKPENPLVLVILHLALTKRTRQQQLEFVSEIVNCYEHVVVMGDFNCQPESTELNYLIKTTDLCDPEHGLMTFPSWRPSLKLDHILTSSSLEVTDVHVLEHLYSDHLPIAMEIKLPEGLELAA